MKKILAFVLCMLLVVAPIATVGAFADAAADPGYTLTNKTYTVTTADGLFAVAELINGGKLDHNITLAADIDLKEKPWTPIGNQYPDKTQYKGVFDGAGFTIKNLKIHTEHEDINTNEYAGFIGQAGNGCIVKNLKLEYAEVVSNQKYVGIVVGYAAKGNAFSMENVHVTSSKATTSYGKDGYVGGLIGRTDAYATTIKNCTVYADLIGDGRVGGILGGEGVGSSQSGRKIEVSNCIVGGNFKANTPADAGDGTGVGGIMGYYSTIPLTLTNVVVVADMELGEGSSSKSTVGSIAITMNKLTLTADSFIGAGALYGKIQSNSSGTNTITDSYIYKVGSTDAELGIHGTIVANSAEVDNTKELTIGAGKVKWDAAKLPVINSVDALKTKVAEIFNGNTVITAAVQSGIVGHVHTFDRSIVKDWYFKSEANCKTAALYYKSCVCGAASSNDTDLFENGEKTNDHPWSDYLVGGAEGHSRVCTTCGVADTLIPHNPGYPATHISSQRCLDCYYTLKNAIGHTYSTKWTTNSTSHWNACSCGEKINVGEHKFGDNVTDAALKTAADCKNAAVYYKSCSVCGVLSNETFTHGAPVTHRFENYKSDGNATCTADGTKTAKCVSCDVTDTKADEGSKTGHAFGEFKSDNNATCVADGTKSTKCANCGLVDSEIVKGSALGHSYGEFKSDGNATCTADGTKTATCAKCGETDVEIDRGSIAAHSYDGKVCTVCGVEDPSHINSVLTTVVIVLAAVVVVGGAVIAVLAVKKRK